MTARLARLVVRVPIDLNGALTTIAARLFNETRLEYSLASIVRGLVAIGLLTVADTPHLAPLFIGVRVARGRKKGALRPPGPGISTWNLKTSTTKPARGEK